MEINSSFVDPNVIKTNKLSNVTKDSLKGQTDDSLRNVCNDFEAFFMNQILEVSLKSTNVAGEGTGSKIIQGMYTDAISQSSAGSMGISDMLYTFLSEKK